MPAEMTTYELLAVAGAGLVAGAANTVAGGGSLLSFPVLVATGLSPLAANVTNTVGLVTSTAGGALGYRRELRGQWGRVLRLLPPCILGSLIGIASLLLASAQVFEAVVPFLIAGSCLLLLFSPRLQAVFARRRGPGREGSIGLYAGSLGAGWYGGYFGAAVGILWLGVLGLFLSDDLQRLNGLKNVLSAVVNLVAAAAIVAFGPVDWPAALTLLATSLVGGYGIAGVARRLPATGLRVGIAVVGLTVAAVLFVR